MIKDYKYIALGLLFSLLITACSKDGADGNDVTKTNEQTKEIGIKPDVWKMTEATRATMYDNTTLQSGFTVYAYKENTTTAYIDDKTVSYSAPNWIITGRPYYWPDYNLDFFAYAPSSKPAYITAGPTYTAEHDVTFTCSNLPLSYSSASPAEGQGGLIEFIYGMALGKNRENSLSGVPLTFQHPFARIKLQLAASHPNVTINSITFNGINNSGSFTYDHSESTSTWAPSGNANFVLTLTSEAAVFDNNPNTPVPIGGYSAGAHQNEDFIMIPQSWTGVIVVNADCLFWGVKKNYPSLTTTVATTWQPGYSYTYTFNISPDDLKVNVSQFTEQW